MKSRSWINNPCLLTGPIRLLVVVLFTYYVSNDSRDRLQSNIAVIKKTFHADEDFFVLTDVL